jgi:hypothetical protein
MPATHPVVDADAMARITRQCYHSLPPPRTTLRARYVALLVWCKGGCQHQAHADLQALIEQGRGDVPLTSLRFRCSTCGSDRTDWIITSKGATAVQPW